MGYAVVGLFALVYGLIRSGWPHLAQPSALTIAVLAVAPLALALVWDRLGGIKAFGIELTLTTAAIPTASMATEVVAAITEEQYWTGNEAIVEQVTQAIVRPEQELLNVNLRDGHYWWSTRLFLVAALAEDYSRIQQLVFIEQGGPGNFVGMAAPGSIRRALAMVWPTLEQSYKEINAKPGRRPGTSRLANIVIDWSAHQFSRDGKPVGEESLKEEVDHISLHKWLSAIGKRLTTDSVDWPGVSDPYLVRSLLFDYDSPYVALLRHGRLDRVVNRLDLALRVAGRALG